MRLLCADDDPDIRTVLTLALRLDPTFEVEVFASGAALIAASRVATPDAVLLDVQMPELDGYQTCAALKANAATAEVPVVFLSASAAPADLDRARAAGAVGCLAKPFDPLELARAFRAALR